MIQTSFFKLIEFILHIFNHFKFIYIWFIFLKFIFFYFWFIIALCFHFEKSLWSFLLKYCLWFRTRFSYHFSSYYRSSYIEMLKIICFNLFIFFFEYNIFSLLFWLWVNLCWVCLLRVIDSINFNLTFLLLKFKDMIKWWFIWFMILNKWVINLTKFIMLFIFEFLITLLYFFFN